MAGGLWRVFDQVADQKGEEPALIQGDHVISFTELRRQANRLASALVRVGVRVGDRCIIWSPNSSDQAAAILAVWRAGGIVALVYDEAPQSHLKHAADVTQPAAIIVQDKLAETAAALSDCPIVVLGTPDEGCESSEPLPDAQVNDFEPASIFFTSGSTGEPKGVTQSHATLLAGCRMVAAHMALTQNDRILCPVPWAFDYGYGQLLSTFLLGVSHVLPALRSPYSLCEAIEQHRPTIMAGLPSTYALLLRGLSPIRQTDLSSLRLLTNTGGAIAPAIFKEIREVFSHCQISLNYGMTETYRSAGLPMHLADARPESVGFAYPGVGLVVLRDDGEEAAPGEVGEIIHRGTGTFMGYWGAPEATAKVLRKDPLWRHAAPAPMAVYTGDLGWKDEEGFLMIKGRRDRLIKSMGVRVSLDEIEAIIHKAKLIRDVVVVGVPHDIMGEVVTAAIIPLEGGEDPVPALKALARREMSQHMQPRGYHVFDAFPLTPNGKTDFGRLRTLLSQPTRRE